jgi:hypothetical protein
MGGLQWSLITNQPAPTSLLSNLLTLNIYIMKQLLLIIVVLIGLNSCCKEDLQYDRSTCKVLLDKSNTMYHMAKANAQDSVAIYNSMEWKSLNVDLLTHCRYYNQINHMTRDAK